MTEKEFSIMKPLLNSDALRKRYGNDISESELIAIRSHYIIRMFTNNWRKRHRLPMRRRNL